MWMLAFNGGMLLSPLAFSLFWKADPEDVASGAVDADRVRRRRSGLWSGTLLALVVWGVLAFLEVQGAFNPESMPRWMTWGQSPAEFGWMLFFPLWFGLAMPLLQELQPAQGMQREEAKRSASLVARETPVESVAKPWLTAGWIGFGLTTTALLAGVNNLFGLSEQNVRGGVLFAACAMITQVTLLLVLPMAVRHSHLEPEPLAGEGSEELTALYAAAREGRLHWMLRMFAGSVALLAVGSWALVTFNLPSWVVALTGAGLGTLGGLGGAWIGMSADRRRREIQRRRNELLGGDSARVGEGA